MIRSILTIFGVLGSLAPIWQSDEVVPPKERIDHLLRVFVDPQAGAEHEAESLKAVAALVAMGKPVVPKLIDAILDERYRFTWVPDYCLLALDRIGKDAVAEVRARWKTLDEYSKWRFMGFRGQHDYDAVVDYALDSLRSSEPYSRWQATEYLGRHQETRARDALLKILDAEPHLREPAIKALARIGGEDVVDAFIAQLSRDGWAGRDEGFLYSGRVSIVNGLGQLKARRAGPALLSALNGPASVAEGIWSKAYLDQRIISVLGDLGDAKNIPALRRILTADRPRGLDSYWNDRQQETHLLTARVLWQLGDRSGRWILVATRDAFSCKAISELGDQGDIWVLASQLDLGRRERDREEKMAAACRGLERIMGVVNRAKSTMDDAPLWKAWYQKYKVELKEKKTNWDLARLPKESPVQTDDRSVEDMEGFYKNLAIWKRAEGYGAFLALAASKQAVPFLKERLHPIVVAGTPNWPQIGARLGAMAVLEEIGTREAAELLQTLAAGAPESWMTQEANAALARLTKQAATKP